jgi:ABC-2 type transport system ATP-binding protein
VIEARNLSKRYSDKVAVDDLSFSVLPGRVTGFLGPNGAGKSTTMRLLLGLDRPTNGASTINGKPFAQLTRPLHEVGALMESRAVHPGRSARNHLLAMAATTEISKQRVNHVLEMVGLSDVADKRVRGFSLGMGQRLGIASALLADPGILILDEPINGLDPDGIRWVRSLLKGLAREGRTVFLSSHLMSEMAQTADHVIVVNQGKLLRDQPMSQLIAEAGSAVVRVRSPQARELEDLLVRTGVSVCRHVSGALEVEGHTAEEIGTAVANAGLILYELSTRQASLEEAYMALTEGSLEFACEADELGGSASTSEAGMS